MQAMVDNRDIPATAQSVQMRRFSDGQAPDGRRDFGQGDIVFESVLGRNLQGGPIRLHRMLVDALRQLMQAAAPAAETLFQFGQRQRAQVAHGGNVERGQFRLHHLAHAGQPAHFQWGEETFDLVRTHHEQTIGLAEVRGDLGQELVRRHACRGGQLRLFAYRRADRLRRGGGRGQAGLGHGHVEIGPSSDSGSIRSVCRAKISRICRDTAL